jgi:hypothetical protein
MIEEMSTKLPFSDILLKAIKLPFAHTLTFIKLAIPLIIISTAIPLLLLKMFALSIGATGGAIYNPSLDIFLLF